VTAGAEAVVFCEGCREWSGSAMGSFGDFFWGGVGWGQQGEGGIAGDLACGGGEGWGARGQVCEE